MNFSTIKTAPRRIAATIQNAFTTEEQMRKKVQRIHKEFNTAGETLLAEAKEIINRGLSQNSKGDRLARLGFTNSADSKKAFKDQQDFSEAQRTANYVMDYSQRYPFYKFITEKQVQQICKKYGLIKGAASRYIGSVPEKNVAQMEAFKVDEKDVDNSPLWGNISVSFDAMRGALLFNPATPRIEFIQTPISPSPSKNEFKPSFEICAPAKDFNMDRAELARDGYTLQNIPDPVVLCKVKGGYFIVTAWGDEASDEIVVNQKNN